MNIELKFTGNCQARNLKTRSSRGQKRFGRNGSGHRIVGASDRDRIDLGLSTDRQVSRQAVVVVQVVSGLEDVDETGSPFGGLRIAEMTIPQT